MKLMGKLNKLSIVSLILGLGIFNLNMSMENPKEYEQEESLEEGAENRNVETTYLEEQMGDLPMGLGSMPLEMDFEILDKLVGSIIKDNIDLDPLALVKRIANKLLPLRLINPQFNDSVLAYIRGGKLKEILQQSYDIDIEPYLVRAICENLKAEFTLLIEAGFNAVNARDEYDNTALTCAAKNGYKEIVELLIKSGVEVNLPGHFDFTPLMNAVYGNHEDIVKLLIEKGAKIDYQSSMTGQSALSLAAGAGNYNLVLLFINNGANVNIKDNDDYTPLIKAAENGNFEIVQLLLERGATIGENIGKYIDIALAIAAEKGFFEIVKLLVNKGAYVNSQARQDHTALMFAAENGYFEIVKFLVNKGADVRERNGYGQTALDLAEAKGYKEIAQYLEEEAGEGTDIEIDTEGYLYDIEEEEKEKELEE